MNDNRNAEGAAIVRPPGHLFDNVEKTIRRYCFLPGEHEYVAVTLWVVLTHLLSLFDYAPRLVIRSAEKRSGKSRLLEVIDALVYAPLRAVNATVAYIFRSLTDDPPPTLLFDECDTIFGSRKVAENNEELRGLLNAGFQRGLPFGRTVGPMHIATEFSTFAMAALAGIGRMPETIEDRAVVVVMKRRTAGEHVQPYRISRDGPGLNQLRDQIAEWAATITEISDDPDLPVEDRAADLWAPLVAVADLAGGSWPERARDAATALVDSATTEDTSRSTNLQLLADIRDVLDTEFIKSADLCSKLRELTESPWEQYELNPSRLGRRLREYQIKTGHSDDKKERGYRRSDFADAFSRYLTSPKKASKASEGVHQHSDQKEQPDTFTDPNPSEDTNEGVPDTMDDDKTSHDNRTSDPMSDTLDTFGRLSGMPEPDTATPTPLTARKQELSHRRTIRVMGREVPRCIHCGKGVMAGQGDAHHSCASKRNTA